MKNSLYLLLLCLLIGLPLSGCMHSMMMPGSSGVHHTPGDTTTSGTTLVKEIHQNGVRATATIPPLQAHKESRIVIALADEKTGEQISGARVEARVTRTGGDSLSSSVTTFQFVEGEDSYYSAMFTPHEPGGYLLHIRITGIPGLPDDAPLVFEAVQVAQAHADDHSAHNGMMMGGGGHSVLYMVVGGAVMVGMMVAMFIGSGGMF